MTNLSTGLSSIPASARALTAIGDRTADAVALLYASDQASLFPPEDNQDFFDLAQALHKKRWTDVQSSELVRAYGEALAGGRQLDVRALTRWVLAHSDSAQAEAVLECVEVEPPEEIDIIRVLSRKGSQKIVFLATWRLFLREVVLKKVLGSGESAAKILSREMRPHPLNLSHPNIIETHFLRNGKGEVFLVEERLGVVLSDSWTAGGVHEASNLLVHIARALKHLHDNSLVHGDVKPDNIGKSGESYILLDFGICRPTNDFTAESTPTGSLRTRAPELLQALEVHDPSKIDVWALAATVYNSLVGRFPLIGEGEVVPRISQGGARTDFEAQLGRRVASEWDHWVNQSSIPEPLRPLLSEMLRRDPADRPTTAEVLKRAERELAAYLRHTSATAGGKFSPVQELQQIEELLSQEHTVRLIPLHKKQQLTARLTAMKAISGFEHDTDERIADLVSRLS
jgi:serine/threonine protein kinase